MKKILLLTFVAAAFAVGTNAYAILAASDSGANYGSGWTNGANGGSGYQPWVLANNNGAPLFAGNFIGDPASAGISGMATNSFGLYANPAGAFSTAERLFSSPLSPGATFSLQWGVWTSRDQIPKRCWNLTVSPGPPRRAGASEPDPTLRVTAAAAT